MCLNVADRHPQFQGLLMKQAVSPLAREAVSISSISAFYISPIQVKKPLSWTSPKTLNDHLQHIQHHLILSFAISQKPSHNFQQLDVCH